VGKCWNEFLDVEEGIQSFMSGHGKPVSEFYVDEWMYVNSCL
jgi:hypothetical protein